MYMYIYIYIYMYIYVFHENPAKMAAKKIFVEGEIRGHARVWTIDKLEEARTNADDQMMLVQHYSGDRVMS